MTINTGVDLVGGKRSQRCEFGQEARSEAIDEIGIAVIYGVEDERKEGDKLELAILSTSSSTMPSSFSPTSSSALLPLSLSSTSTGILSALMMSTSSTQSSSSPFIVIPTSSSTLPFSYGPTQLSSELYPAIRHLATSTSMSWSSTSSVRGVVNMFGVSTKDLAKSVHASRPHSYHRCQLLCVTQSPPVLPPSAALSLSSLSHP
ncbi:hypothetical protein EJ110_NYTH28486 [Nymphaea thermarum]|nr:hypothetical protein EJ110_NYTH28486 [Nymphaea thermarum]